MTLAVGLAFAQQSTNRNGFQINAKPTSDVIVPEVTFVNGTTERGAAFWTEDFANGMGSTNGTWTTDGAEGSVWKHDFFGTSGCWSGNTPTPATTSAANGFMLFDADSANCVNPSTNPPTFTQNVLTGGLISPTIDCSSQASVLLSFEQSLRYCCSAALTLYVYVSDDNGTTWSAPIDVLYGLAVNAQSANPQTVAVNISAYTNSSSTVKIKFEWGGVSHYYWAIDDINLSPAPCNNTRLNSATFWNETRDAVFGVPVDYPIVPANQIDNLVLKGQLDNQGSCTATNMALEYVVTNSASAVVANGTSTPADLASGSTRQDSAIWAHSATLETYSIRYKGDHDNFVTEGDTTDNIKNPASSIMTVANSGAGVQYARDNNIATGSGLWNGDGNAYIMGNVFQVYTTTTLYSIDVAYTTNSDAGVTSCVILYEMDPGAATANDVFVAVVDQCLDGVEYTLGASNFSSSTTMVWNRYAINPTSPMTGYTLNAGTQYLAAVNHYGGTENLVIQSGGGTPNGDASVWIYDPTATTGGPWFYMTSKPKIRLGLDNTVGMIGVNDNLTAENLTLGQNMPNPFNGTTTISYTLEEAADVTFTIVDVTGKVVYSEVMGTKGAGVYNMTINSSDFASGVYYYTMTAGTDKLTKKMIITE